ncbi:MAG: VWA domain-containing protein, partial [Planctomycetes bacterium]|nr:VWA domain-containing protein [Planctomycetota bacterium]
ANPPTAAFDRTFGSKFTSKATANPRKAYVWFTFTGQKDGEKATATVTIQCKETKEKFKIPVSANTVARPNVATVLVLDKSGSMSLQSGIGNSTRLDVLRYSAPPFIDLLQQNNAVGIVSFDQDAYPVMPVSGPLSTVNLPDPTRISAKAFIAAHNYTPHGLTSIGDGL